MLPSFRQVAPNHIAIVPPPERRVQFPPPRLPENIPGPFAGTAAARPVFVVRSPIPPPRGAHRPSL